MGQDWIPKVEKSIKRRLDRARADLCTPDLFSYALKCEGRIVAAELEPNTQTAVGDTFVASLDGQEVRLYRGNTLIGRLLAPTPEEAISLAKSPAVATVCDVLPFTDGRGVEVRLS